MGRGTVQFSPDRMREHAERHLDGFSGVLQADTFAGFNQLYDPARRPGPLVEAACWAPAHRRFFVFADVAAKARGRLPVLAPLALAAVERIDAIFAFERKINGLEAAARLVIRRERLVPRVTELKTWIRAERAKLSRHADVAKAMDHMLKRWPAFERFVHDEQICLINNAAERALRGITLGRKAWLFAGSVRAGERAAVMYMLIQTARLNGVAWTPGQVCDRPGGDGQASADLDMIDDESARNYEAGMQAARHGRISDDRSPDPSTPLHRK